MSDGSIFPVVRYADPVAAAEWLCSAYGFSIHHIAERPDGGTSYVVLRFGENFVLVGPHASSAFDDLMVQPADVGNRSTQTCYLTVKDVDQHFARAQTAGARVEVEPRDDGNGGRFYMSRDPDGHLWSFGRPLVGATLAEPDRLSERPRRYFAVGGRAAIGVAALVGAAVGFSAMFYLGTDLTPRALTAWIGGIRGPNALAEAPNAFATKRLADSEAAAVDLTEKLQIAQLEYAEAEQLKQNAEKLLRASEADYQSRLKDSQGALEAAVRAKEVASLELEAERQRAQTIQTQLDEASQQSARLRAEGGKFEVEARRLRSAMGQLGDALLGSTQAAEVVRAQLATAQSTEKELRDRLRVSERETTNLRARAAELESDKEAARARTGQAARAARTALAIARANQLRHRGKRSTSERGTAELPPRAVVSESEMEAAKVRTVQAAQAARTALAAARANQLRPRDKLPISERGTTATPPRAIISGSRRAAAKVRAQKAAEAARTAPAVSPQASEVASRDKLPTGERGTAEAPPQAIISGSAREVAKVRTEKAAEIARTAPAAAPKASEVASREKLPASERGTPELPQHHLLQGKKWNSVAAIEKGEPQMPVAPKVLDNGARSPCGLAVRDLVFRRRNGGALQTRVIRRLCVDSYATQEPAKCLSRLINGRVNWGGGTDWDFKNAVDLCARTRNAATTLRCFSRKIAAKASWESAIATCSAT